MGWERWFGFASFGLHWFGLVVRPLPVLVSNKEVPSYCVECCAAAAPISLLCAIRRSLEVLYNI